jgi:hypothetical protein
MENGRRWKWAVNEGAKRRVGEGANQSSYIALSPTRHFAPSVLCSLKT